MFWGFGEMQKSSKKEMPVSSYLLAPAVLAPGTARSLWLGAMAPLLCAAHKYIPFVFSRPGLQTLCTLGLVNAKGISN